MANKYLNYTVSLQNADQVRDLQAAYPNGRYLAPASAASTYAAPIEEESAAFSAPCTRSSWFTSEANYPRDEGTFRRKKGGFFGAIAGIFGVKDTYWWLGYFAFSQPAAGSNPTTGATVAAGPCPMPQRRFICGFELPPNSASSPAYAWGEGPNNRGSATMCSRNASRVPGGLGLAMRGGQGQASITQTFFSGGGAATNHRTWERLYVRRRANGVGGFWCALSSGSTGVYFVSSGADIIVYNGSTGTSTVLGTFSGALPNIGQWYLLDILVSFSDGVAAGSIELFVGHVSKGSLTVTFGGGGIGSNVAHDNSQLAHLSAGSASNDFEMDVDDWMAADWPAIPYDSATNYSLGDIVWAGNRSFYKAKTAVIGVEPSSDGTKWDLLSDPVDWGNGVHMQLVRPTGDSASRTGWTGDYRLALQGAQNGPAAKLEDITSSTSAALFAVTSDAAAVLKNWPEAKGVASFVVAAHTLRGGAGNGSVGYKISGASAVDTAVTQQTTRSWQGAMYRPAAATDGIDISPLELRFTKAANTNADKLTGIGAVAELLGRFGSEDMPSGASDIEVVTSPRRGPTHNCPYPLSQWVRAKQAPPSPFAMVAGTYVGDGAGVELTFRLPVHFLYVRPTSTANPGGRWFSSLVGGHSGVDETQTPGGIVRVEVDPTFASAVAEDDQEVRYRVRFAGTNANFNANGVTYAYVALCDPGQRFISCGGHAHNTSSVTDTDNSLEQAAFTPDALLFQSERTEGSTTDATAWKGPGHGASDVTRLGVGSGNIATGASFNGAGRFTAKSGLYQSNMTLGWMAIRNDDLSGDANIPKTLRVFTYTGDGNASRTLSIPGGSAVRPLWAMIVPHSTVGAYVRDPSHTTTHSTIDSSGADSTTGITGGGIEQITLGSALNVNLTVYDVFVIMGSATAGNGGWSIPGEFMPVDITDAPGGDYTPVPDPADQGLDDNGDPAEPTPEVSTDMDIDNATAVGTAGVNVGGLVGGQPCEVYTRGVVNRSLRQLGISKRITDLVNQTTVEAITSRDTITDDINEVLRDFDWPFATRYADLVLVAGTVDVAVNGDWQYSYRTPAAMMKARRIVSQDDKRRDFDASPIKFRIGSDATGPLLFCNEAATDDIPLTLEYTTRQSCPVFFGDALFREALSWKHASSLAMPLSKDSKKQEFCLQMYQQTLRNAQVPAAQEQQQAPNGDASWISDRN